MIVNGMFTEMDYVGYNYNKTPHTFANVMTGTLNVFHFNYVLSHK